MPDVEDPGPPSTAASPTGVSRPRGGIVVMGVSGCGKTRVGQALAAVIAATFIEGDEFHPPENVARMRSGVPLTDADRAGWLNALADRLGAARTRDEAVVLACSALKRRYRDRLRGADANLVFVHLTGSRELIAQRMASRTGHYMPATLLDSQYRDLEPPVPDEPALTCDVRETPEQICHRIQNWLATGERCTTGS